MSLSPCLNATVADRKNTIITTSLINFVSLVENQNLFFSLIGKHQQDNDDRKKNGIKMFWPKEVPWDLRASALFVALTGYTRPSSPSSKSIL